MGVTNAYRYGADDYKFLEKEYENLHPQVHFVLLKNESEYNSTEKELGYTMGFSECVYSLDTRDRPSALCS